MRTLQEYLHILRPIAQGVSAMFGPNCEVVVHDFEQIDRSIILIENSQVTGRRVGDTLTNLGLEKLRQGAIDNELINYSTQTSDGRTLRSTSIFVRDADGKALGALCINFDVSTVQVAVQVLQSLTGGDRKRLPEDFTADVNQLLDRLVEEATEAIGKPVALMTREDKFRSIEFLESKGAFLVKRSVEKVATALDLSKFTVYGYLDQIRSRTDAPIA